MNLYDRLGRTHIMWLLVLVCAMIAFFAAPADRVQHLPYLLTFLGAAGGFTTGRSMWEDKYAPPTSTPADLSGEIAPAPAAAEAATPTPSPAPLDGATGPKT